MRGWSTLARTWASLHPYVGCRNALTAPSTRRSARRGRPRSPGGARFPRFWKLVNPSRHSWRALTLAIATATPVPSLPKPMQLPLQDWQRRLRQQRRPQQAPARKHFSTAMALSGLPPKPATRPTRKGYEHQRPVPRRRDQPLRQAAPLSPVRSSTTPLPALLSAPQHRMAMDCAGPPPWRRRAAATSPSKKATQRQHPRPGPVEVPQHQNPTPPASATMQSFPAKWTSDEKVPPATMAAQMWRHPVLRARKAKAHRHQSSSPPKKALVRAARLHSNRPAQRRH
mmetsp:Transcript_111265/g.314046  ORF Transcript_111265/g.314046 Transcript_111265/m.314046 type:complete len:284 (-) Transcript_111265:771-1622(-)